MIAVRALSLLAAVLLVGAFAIALLGPQDMTLADALQAFDAGGGARMQALVGPGVWRVLAAPLMVRPVWLPLAALGLVSAGVALTLNTGRSSQTRRRRS